MKCPACQQSLVGIDYQGVHIETCPACGGDWLDASQLKSIVTARQTRFTPAECIAVAKAATIAGTPAVDKNRHLQCPNCSSPTNAVNYGDDSGLIIDKCPKCRGVWLAKGELDKIDELVHGWDDELPDDLAQYGPMLRRVAVQEAQYEQVHITHIRLIDSMINNILNFIGD